MKFKNSGNSIYNLKDNSLRLSIHKLRGVGDNLYLNCYALGITDFDLHTEDFTTAVANSKMVITRKINMLVAESRKYVQDNSEIEFTEY